jgi:hypothetical protein
MQTLLATVINLLNRPLDIYRKVFTRLIWRGLRESRPRLLWRDLVKNPIASLFIDDRKQVFFPKLGEATLKAGRARP